MRTLLRPSWPALARALKSPVINRGDIAKEIEKMPVSLCQVCAVVYCVYIASDVCVCTWV